MADTPETPPTSAKAPTPPRRRAATRKTAKPVAAKKPATKAADAEAQPAAAKRPTTPKPRSTKRATPAPARRAPKAAAKPASTAKVASDDPATSKTALSKASEKVGGKWAVAGGVAAIGVAATAALLSLRGSTPKAPKPKGAHTADGTDASKSFRAGIADEGTIPDKG